MKRKKSEAPVEDPIQPFRFVWSHIETGGFVVGTQGCSYMTFKNAEAAARYLQHVAGQMLRSVGKEGSRG